ncbi:MULTISPECIES: PucR family transcriptional regulator [unclassified Nocardioides]|uniref:PucR family transcriptional regulator n=1 Tax=unclassified Nocardioides TaxID=2615069 RepID=UPI0009E6ED59|nr:MULTISPECIES: helix-turn-helix domain-containing protein [unclassified Nocardioides]
MSAAETELRGVAGLLAERRVELTAYLVGQFGERIPELPKDPTLVELLDGSSGANLENLAHLLRGHMPISEVQAPAAAVEYARRLAQRGTPPSALLRAYRLGQQLILRWAYDEIARRVADPALALQTTQLLTETSFEYVDAVSEDVIVAYQDERERWLANRSAVQRETVDALLRGERLDLTATEATLGYRLRQHHLGLVLWTTGAEAGLAESERLLTRLGQRVGAGGHALFVPRDRDTAWGWLPIGRSAEIDLDVVAEVLAEAADGIRVAVGVPEAGEPGFRTTHLAAAAAHQVALLGQQGAPVVSYADPTIRAAALLANDLDATRRMVARTLGELAADTEPAARMRETLLAFVEDRESYVATAARLHLHKNTVKYRVDRAIEARGKPLGEERLDLELALVACRWLGPEVLRG